MTSAKTFPAAAPPKFASIGSPYFGIMLAVMAVVLILSNIGASKGVAIGPIITDGGFFLFPLAYILGDVISEVYGFKVARKAIVTTFALSVFASLCYWIIIALPGFDDEFGAAKQAALEGALGPVPQIVLASLLAFLAGQTINSWILVKMKARTGEKSLWARIMGSSVAGEFVDTLIFCSIAASVIGISDVGMFVNYVLVGFLYKTLVEFLFVPVTAARHRLDQEARTELRGVSGRRGAAPPAPATTLPARGRRPRRRSVRRTLRRRRKGPATPRLSGEFGGSGPGPAGQARSRRLLNSCSRKRSFHSTRRNRQPSSVRAFSRRRSSKSTSAVGL